MFDWSLYFLLLALGLFGAVAVMPYAFAMGGSLLEQVDMPRRRLMLLSLIQPAVLLVIATGLGLLAAEAVGLELPVFSALVAGESFLPALVTLLAPALIVGLMAALLTLGLELVVFRPRMPVALRNAGGQTSVPQRILASFYGGISEELLMRLFLLSGIVWLLSRLNAGETTSLMFWSAIVLAALLFGMGHLPATARITPLTPLVVLRGLLLNGIVGVAAGFLFWRYGLEAAMIAHFVGDIVLVVLPPLFLQASDSDTRNVLQEA